MSRITVDTTIIEQVVGTTVSVALRNTVLGLACIVILFTLAPKLALSILLGSLLVVVPIAVLGRRVRAISTRSQDRIADLGTVTSEVLGAMKIVQAFNQQGRETSRFAEAVGRVFATAKRRILVRAFMTAIVMFLDLRGDHAGHLARRDQRRGGTNDRRHHRRVRALRRPSRRRVRQSVGSLWRPAARGRRIRAPR